MRIWCVCTCLLLATFQSQAQRQDGSVLYAEKVEKYARMKTAGTVLAIAGSVAMVVAIARVSNDDDYSLYSSTSEEEDYYMAATAIAGVSMLGTGIPLWIIGAHNQRKYSKKLKDISVGININSHNGRLTLTYRF